MIRRKEGKYPTAIKSADLYKRFKHKDRVNPTDFYKIRCEINQALFDEMMSNNLKLVMPNLGACRIYKIKDPAFKTNDKGDIELIKVPRKINYKRSKELWKQKWPHLSMDEIYKLDNKPLIYHDNMEVNEYKPSIKWFNGKLYLRNSKFFKIALVRTNNRVLSKQFREGIIDLPIYNKPDKLNRKKFYYESE